MVNFLGHVTWLIVNTNQNWGKENKSSVEEKLKLIRKYKKLEKKKGLQKMRNYSHDSQSISKNENISVKDSSNVIIYSC